MKANYHTHTRRCMHAIGSDEDYVISAIKGGFDILGFSDHTPWKYETDFKANMRMPLSQFQDYYQSIAALREKYKDQIQIKIGLECEYYPMYMDWLENFVKDQQIDYIIFGNHYQQTDEIHRYYGRICKDEKTMRAYVDDAIAGMETGFYSYLAHPELFMRCYPKFDDTCVLASKKICEAAKRLHIPLEYNLAGLAYNEEMHTEEYPHHGFWEIAAECGCDAIIGVDAHDNLDLENTHRWDYAHRYLKGLGIHVLDHLDLPYYKR